MYTLFAPKNATSVVVNGLAADHLYAFNVHILLDNPFTGPGLDGVYDANATTNASTTGSVATAPAAPNELAATMCYDNGVPKVHLHWHNNPNNENGYELQRATLSDFSDATTISVGADVTTYTDSGGDGNSVYYYRVRSTNAAGDSAYSNTASLNTLSHLIVLGFDAFIPMALPNNPSATGWFPEPHSSYWEFAGDMRASGVTGTSRLHTEITIDTLQIGHMESVTGFAHADPSHRRPIGSTTGVETATANATHYEGVYLNDNSNGLFTEIIATAHAGYPLGWKSYIAPDIDYRIFWLLQVTGPNQVAVTLSGSHDLFPEYEAWISSPKNGKEYIYDRPPTDSGPTIYNLNELTTIEGSTTYISTATVSC